MRMNLMISFPLLLLACVEDIEKLPETEDPAGNIEPAVDEINFGELQLGSLVTETIEIENTGDAELNITSVSTVPPFFSNGIAIELAVGDKTSISIQFIPTSYTPSVGSLVIVSDDPDQSQLNIPLIGATITDEDGDGYDTLDAGGDDCDDDDLDTYPGATDQWYDGVDSDCLGNDDYDQDGDGYQTEVWNDDPLANGGDCQDNSTEIYPGATDQWYDGVDSNCDGSDDFDQDGDGSRSLLHGRGLDCDDTNGNINSSGVEAVNNLDDDCDGTIDNPVPAWNSDKTIVGSTGGDLFGWTLTTGDLDSDGKDDLIVGSKAYQGGSGAIAVFPQSSMPSGSQATITNAFNYFAGSTTTDNTGNSLSFISDFGLGTPLLAIGSPGYSSNTGRVHLLDGDEAVYGGDLDDAFLVIEGTSSSYLGKGLSSEIDLDGDGTSDVFGLYRSGSNNYNWLLYGDPSLSGSIPLADVDARFSSSGIDDNTWRHTPNVGDLDGDGLDDIVICDMQIASAYGSSSAVVLWGDTARYENTGTEALSSMGTSLISATGSTSSGGDGYQLYAACGIMPDWNGDGKDEFWGFFTQSDDSFTGVYIFDGDSAWKDGGVDLNPNDDASYFFVTGASFGPVGEFRDVGDWDGDGVSEVGVGFSPTPQSSYSAGRVWIISSQTPSGLNYTSNDVAAVIIGDEEYGQYSYGNILPSRPGDLNNDGLTDWISADWGYTGAINGATGSTDIGAVYLTFQQ